ncbi:hypothetical protein B7P43_G01627 [Cryptotermes secundus]|uniref:Uncharacterized protein n=1 Tax=Cryptotermes secundus TaxID=105785 RepID=A0A2J7QDT7_9NEOP|nr:hypothetical protein B7P43_G01627 [Cryptotermes secundus]
MGVRFQLLMRLRPGDLHGKIAPGGSIMVDKVCIETNPVVKIIATDNWIVKVAPYWLYVVHQSDAALILSSSDTHQVAPGSHREAQYLNIEVKSVRPGVKPFCIRDFDLIPKMKEPLRGIHFISVPEILQAVDRYIRTFNTTGAAKGILRLPHRWQWVVHSTGDYVEGQ